jgi:hypothetical protein
VAQVGISNSEVQNAYSCELAWGFGHHPDMNYQKREFSLARERGVLFHSALETYYKCLQNGDDTDIAASEALNYVQTERVKEIKAGDFRDVERLEALNWIYETLDKYFEYYGDETKYWEILEVEAFHAMEQPGEVDFYLPSRLDLVIYQKCGKFKGETSPVDHKTTYDFWTQPKLQLNSQFPLYILALRAARYAGKPDPVVRRVIVNQIRTRKLDNPHYEDLFKRAFQPYSTIRLQKVFENHMKTAVRLAYLKRLPWQEALTEIKAALGSQSCQYCDFKDICDATFEDIDPSDVIAATLTQNDYGYPPLEVIRQERNYGATS